MLSREVVKLCFTDIGNNNTDPRILHDTARAQVATYYLVWLQYIMASGRMASLGSKALSSLITPQGH